MSMHIALASCRNLPGWEVDDAPFHLALEERGVRISHPVWDDPEVEWDLFDACLIRTTWDYMERQDAYVSWARRVSRLIPFFNPPEIIAWNTKKTYLRDLNERGVAIAPTFFFEAEEQVDLSLLLKQTGWKRGFLKPVVGATARETLRFDQAELGKAQSHLDRLLQNEGMMFQPYLSAVEEVGELSAIFLGGRFSHAVRKIPQKGDYRVQDDFGASDLPVDLSREQRDLAEGIFDHAKAFTDAGDLLYGRVDWLTDDSGELVLTELELVEPSLFFRHSKTAGVQLADSLCAMVGG